MSAPSRVDIVTHYFPPIGGPGSTRMVGWARYLSELGVAVRVIAPEPHRDDPYYQAALEPPPGVEVVLVAGPDLSRPFRRRGAPADAVPAAGDPGPPPAAPSPAGAAAPGWRRALVLAARDLLELPDHRRIWNGAAVRTLARLDPPGEVLITTSPYPSTHLVGLRRKRQDPNLFWVADFRDVWTQHWGRRLHTPLHRAYNRRLERRVCAGADLVTCFHRVGIEQMAARVGNELWGKSEVIVNGVEPEALDWFGAHPFRPSQDPFVLAYAGTTWDWNVPPGFWDAWQAFVAAAPRPVELHLYGRVEPAVRAAVAALPDGPHGPSVRLCGTATPDEVARALGDAGGLVIFAGPYVENVSSKIFECVAARRPILYLGNPQSAGAAFLREVGAPAAVADGFDAAGATGALERLRTALAAGDFAGLVPAALPEGLDRRAQTQRLWQAILSRFGQRSTCGRAAGPQE